MSNFLKIIAAFAAGVVVALGGALLYVRANEMLHPAPAVLQPVSAPVSANDRLAVSQPPPPPAPSAAVQREEQARQSTPEPEESQPAPEPKPVHVAPRETPRPVVRATHSEPEVRRAPIQIAQNTPAPRPEATDASQPSSDQPQSAAAPAPAPDSGALTQPPPSYNPTPATSSATAPSSRQPHSVILPAGTPIQIRLVETLSTAHNYTGDTFRATLDAPIVMNGFIIADRGSKVLGRIVNSQPAGRLQGVADLNLALTEINTTDGQRVSIQTNTNDRKGPSNLSSEGAKIAGGAALGAIIGALAGGGKGAAIGAGAGGAAGTGLAAATHGRACVIPTESRLNFQLATPLILTEKLNY